MRSLLVQLDPTRLHKLYLHAGPSTLRAFTHCRSTRWYSNDLPASHAGQALIDEVTAHPQTIKDASTVYRTENGASEDDDLDLAEELEWEAADLAPEPTRKIRSRGPYESTGRAYNITLEEDAETFDDHVRELMRRKEKAASKRMQKGGFLDHINVHIRGGRGGNGSAAFDSTRTGSLGPPSGGNGGQGGSVYLTTSPTLTSLHSVRRRYTGGPGLNGKGDTAHGKPGEDMVIEVPVGTVLREIRREGDNPRRFDGPKSPMEYSQTAESSNIGKRQGPVSQTEGWTSLGTPQSSEDGDGLSYMYDQMEEGFEEEEGPVEWKSRRPDPSTVEPELTEEERAQYDKLFVLFPGAKFTRSEYRAAVRTLKKGGRTPKTIPTFDDIPPVTLDIDKPITEPILLARGGNGGVGNPFFAGFSGYRQPRIAQRGTVPYTSVYELELKILADVGLVGFPNTGKSTILRALSGSRAEIADYSFTTLNPQIGVVRVFNDGSYGVGGEREGVIQETWKERELEDIARELGEYRPLPKSERGGDKSSRSLGEDGRLKKEKWEVSRFTVSDNPGLLPLASENVGLGHSFLRSIERSLALAYILDITRPDPASDLLALRKELDTYKKGLVNRGCVVVLNKADEVDAAIGKEKVAAVKNTVKGLPEGSHMKTMALSGKFGLGLEKMVQLLGQRVERERESLKP